MRWDGVVLCGGRSRRMGRDKALLTVDGRPLARRVADALTEAGAASVVAIGGDVAGLRASGLRAEPDRWPDEGPLGALVQSLERAPDGTDAVAVLACDLVRPDADAVATMVALLGRGTDDVVVPRVGDRPQWLHAVWRPRVSRLLGDVFASGERSIHGAARGLGVRFTDRIDPAVLVDADTPQDLPAAPDPDVRP